MFNFTLLMCQLHFFGAQLYTQYVVCIEELGEK
jgi:hypothetical protein